MIAAVIFCVLMGPVFTVLGILMIAGVFHGLVIPGTILLSAGIALCVVWWRAFRISGPKRMSFGKSRARQIT